MICAPCARAADQRAPRDHHCDDPKCMCGHKVEKYGKTTRYDVFANFYNQLARATEQARAREEQYRKALPARAAKLADHLTDLLPAEARDAGIHFEYDTTGIAPTELRTIPADYLADPPINLGRLLAGYDDELLRTDTTTALVGNDGYPIGETGEADQPRYIYAQRRVTGVS